MPDLPPLEEGQAVVQHLGREQELEMAHLYETEIAGKQIARDVVPTARLGALGDFR